MLEIALFSVVVVVEVMIVKHNYLRLENAMNFHSSFQ